MGTQPLKLLLADDHPLILEGLITILHKRTQFKILAQASNGKELVNLVGQYSPDVIITDIKMPIMNGVEATRQIKICNPKIEVIALSFMDNEFAIVEMLEAGALGYLNKSSAIAEIIEAVEKVHAKIPYYCSTTSLFLGKEIASSCFNPYRKFKPYFTDQETRIIRFISKGLSSKQISEELNIAIRTVDAHRRNILDNLKIKSPIGIMIYAIKNNLISIEELPNVISDEGY